MILFGFGVAVLMRVTQAILLFTGIAAGSESGFFLETGKIVVRMAAVFLIFYLPYLLRMLGAGDVKLFALATVFLPEKDCIPFFAGSFLFAGVAALVKLCRQKNVRERLYYLGSYVADVIRLGKVTPYLDAKQDRKRVSLHMAGPMMAGLVCHICGLY